VNRISSDSGDHQWGSFCSRGADVSGALADCIDAIQGSWRTDSSQEPQLAIVFVSQTYDADINDVVAELRARLPSLKHIFGCSVSRSGARMALDAAA
jgi:deleted-in-malignant-brain-tumors protein 1